MTIPPLPGRLRVTRYVTDADPHLVVDQARARATDAGRLFLAVCPAGVFTAEPDGTIGVEYAACLECGACLAVAPPGTLTWRHPAGGCGVGYREG